MTNRTFEEIIDNVFHNYLMGGHVYRKIWEDAVAKFGKSACIAKFCDYTIDGHNVKLPPELA